MSARATLVMLLLLTGCTLGAAAPRPSIPSSELPGRERERFIDPFPQPKSLAPPVVMPQHPAPRSKRCAKTRKRC